MKKLLLLFTLITLSFAQNPDVYTALGDKIYDNIEKIKKLKKIPEFIHDKKKIDNYIEDVKKAKKDGHAVRLEKNSANKEKYLQRLRELSLTNDSFVKKIEDNFKISIKNENNKLFLLTVNSELLDTDKYNQEIINYYKKHSKDLKVSGVMESILNKNKQKSIKEQVKANKISNKNIQKAKIKRIKKMDKIKEKELEEELEKELLQKKKDIAENQKKELFNKD
jgi:hypothetical protein